MNRSRRGGTRRDSAEASRESNRHSSTDRASPRFWTRFRSSSPLNADRQDVGAVRAFVRAAATSDRRAIDFQHRRCLLQRLMPPIDSVMSGRRRMQDVVELLSTWQDGRIKLFVTACGLRFRRAHPGLIRDGTYDPLLPDGPAAEHLVGFGRRHESGARLVIVPRLPVAVRDHSLGTFPMARDDRRGDVRDGSGVLLRSESADALGLDHAWVSSRDDVVAGQLLRIQALMSPTLGTTRRHTAPSERRSSRCCGSTCRV
jgi:hypothetical protein